MRGPACAWLNSGHTADDDPLIVWLRFSWLNNLALARLINKDVRSRGPRVA
jgi:hypothetical protein